MNKASIFVVLLAVFLGSLSFVGIVFASNYFQPKEVLSPAPKQESTVTPQPTVDDRFLMYIAPELPKKSEYAIVMVGDSMTHALGPHGGEFYENINEKYKSHKTGILIDNYASGSTNILSINKAMTTKTIYWDSTFEPLLSRAFDLILIESFGYNPLSQFPIEEGLKKHNETLDETMKTLIKTHPEARIAFVATIAPNKSKFSQPISPNTTLEERKKLAEEREAYIKNHIQYAEDHNIPVINIYEKSITPAGEGNLEYINPDDYIHPSAVGVEFIGRELANYIYDTNLIPH